jgi:hypothetical protein
VWLAFTVIALVLLARPPLRALGRLLRGQPVLRDYTAVSVAVAGGSKNRAELAT